MLRLLRAITLALATTPLHSSTAFASQCFFPSGNISYADIQCDPTQEFSPCCFNGQACLSNKICYDLVAGTYNRGTCTDKTWMSPNCPAFCPNKFDAGNLLLSCNVTAVDAYCCNEGCSCGNPMLNEIHTLGTTQPYTLTIIGSATTFPTTTLPSSASGARATETVTETASSTGGQTDSKSAVAVGAGVGAGVGGGLLACTVVMFLLFRQKRPLGPQRGYLENEAHVKESLAKGKGVTAESGGGPVHEVSGRPAVGELPGDTGNGENAK